MDTILATDLRAAVLPEMVRQRVVGIAVRQTRRSAPAKRTTKGFTAPEEQETQQSPQERQQKQVMIM